MTPAYTTLLSIVNEANPDRVKQDIDLADVLMVLGKQNDTYSGKGIFLWPDGMLDVGSFIKGTTPKLLHLPLSLPVREWPEETLEKIIELVKV